MNENITAAHDDLNFKDQRALKVTKYQKLYYVY